MDEESKMTMNEMRNEAKKRQEEYAAKFDQKKEAHWSFFLVL